ncbi:MAG: hypothetical protein ACR2PI_28420 [Hyphomicrobiaceae bacterium]
MLMPRSPYLQGSEMADPNCLDATALTALQQSLSASSVLRDLSSAELFAIGGDRWDDAIE